MVEEKRERDERVTDELGIEVTPEMVAAGLDALIEYRNEGDARLVEAILEAGLRQLSAARATPHRGD
jgi:hypothetical protein